MTALCSYQIIAGEFSISVQCWQEAPNIFSKYYKLRVKVAKVRAINFQNVGSQSGARQL